MDSKTLEALFTALDEIEGLDSNAKDQPWFKVLENHAEAEAAPLARRKLDIPLH